MEQLENRAMMAVTVTGLELAVDTGVSATDKITSNPALSGTTSGSPVPYGSAQIQFDHDGDGDVDGYATVSGGTFSYNPLATDSALENWEGALTIRYRTRELDGYGGELAVGDWQNFDMTLDRKAASGTLSDIQVYEWINPITNVDLGAKFNDGVTADSLLQYQVVGNTNPDLFSDIEINNGILKLTYDAPGYGTSYLTLRVTDQAGNSRDVVQKVTVIDYNRPPEIVSISATALDQHGRFLFTGSVDDDTSMAGMVVYFWITGTDMFSATINGSGQFSVEHTIPPLTNLVYAVTFDAEYCPSDVYQVSV